MTPSKIIAFHFFILLLFAPKLSVCSLLLFQNKNLENFQIGFEDEDIVFSNHPLFEKFGQSSSLLDARMSEILRNIKKASESPTQALLQTIYVNANTGNDQAPTCGESLQNPCRSISVGFSKATDNSTIFIRYFDRSFCLLRKEHQVRSWRKKLNFFSKKEIPVNQPNKQQTIAREAIVEI